jgi:acyl-CoA thioesterase
VTEAQRRAEAIVRGMLARDQFSRWLGVEVLELGVGRCRCGMRVREEMVNGFGVAHGGIAFSLADSALAFASNAQGRIALSIENGMSYPAAIRPGDSLIATAEEETATNRLAFYRVRIANQRDEIVALFRGTVYRTSEEHPR